MLSHVFSTLAVPDVSQSNQSVLLIHIPTAFKMKKDKQEQACSPNFTGLLHNSDVRNTSISVQDFSPEECSKHIDNLVGYSRIMIYHSFHTKSEEAFTAGNFKSAKIYALLASACHINIFKANEAEHDFLVENISFFKDILQHLYDHAICGYLNDFIAVMCRKNRDIGDSEKYTLAAFDDFISLPFNEKVWRHGNNDCWNRALKIARSYSKKRSDLMQRAEAALIDGFFSRVARDAGTEIAIANFIISASLGKQHANEIASRLHEIAQNDATHQEFLKAERAYETALVWFNKVETLDEREAFLSDYSLFLEAQAKVLNPLFAEHNYHRAYSLLSRIRVKEREKWDVSNRLKHMGENMKSSALQASKTIPKLITRTVDVTARVRQTEENFRGLCLNHAVRRFFLPLYYFSKESCVDRAIDSINSAPIFCSLPKVFFNSDGQIISRENGIDDINSVRTVPKIRDREAVRVFVQNASYFAGVFIMPGLEIIMKEHAVSFDYILNLMKTSPAFEERKADIIAKGIHAGFRGDYVSALHILLPQFEGELRRILKAAGAQASHIEVKEDTTEVDYYLGSLMKSENQEILNDIFGEEIIFQISAVFNDPYGMDFRNQIAHGRVTTEDCISTQGIYAWWLLSAVFLAPSLQEENRSEQ